MKFLLVLLLTIPALASVKTTFSDGSQPINAGGVDASFNVTSQPNGKINDILPLPNGGIIVGGEFTKCGEFDQAYLAMFDPNGSLVTSFAPVLDGRINTIALNEDKHSEIFPKDSLFVGGAFTNVNGTAQGGFAILKSDGSSFEFGLSPGFDGEVHAIVGPEPSGDDSIFIGGSFSSFNETMAQNFVRMTPDFSAGTQTAQIESLQVNGPVFNIEDITPSHPFQSGYYIGGQFTQIREAEVSNIAQVSVYGDPFSSGIPLLEIGGTVREIVVIDSEAYSVVARGDFETFGGRAAPGIAFFQPGQSEWVLVPVSIPDSAVTSLAGSLSGQVRLGHLDGSVSHYCGSYQNGSGANWARTAHFSQGDPVLSSSVTASQSDEFVDQRLGHNSYHASASGELIRLYGLHGSSPPPAPSPEFVIRNDQIQAILPLGLSLLEQACEISSDHGQHWQALDPQQEFLFKGLFPNHAYLLRARYRNSNGFGPYSMPLEINSPQFAPSSGSQVPILQDADVSLGGVLKIAQGANDSVLVDGAISGTRNSIPFSHPRALSLFDSNLRLISILSEFKSISDLYNSFTPMSDGSILFLGWKFENGRSWTEIIKRAPDLSPDESFPSIKVSGYDPIIALVGTEGGFASAEITNSDPPNLLLTRFTPTGEIQDTSLIFNISGPLNQLVALPSGEFLIDGFFQNLPGFPDQIFTRIHITREGFLSPFLLSSFGRFGEWWPARFIAKDGAQFFMRYTANNLSSSEKIISLSKTDIQGNILEGFSAEFKEVRYIRPKDIWLNAASNNKLIVSGGFSHCNGTPSPGIVRLNSDGSIDNTFQPFRDRSFDLGILQNGTASLSDDSLIFPSLTTKQQKTRLIKLRGNTTPDDRTLWASAHGFASFIPNADPDLDGLTQEIELLYGLDPNKPGTFHPVSFTNENGSLTTKVTPPLFPLGLPVFESSPNLEDWQPSPLKSDFTVDSLSPRSFIRLKN